MTRTGAASQPDGRAARLPADNGRQPLKRSGHCVRRAYFCSKPVSLLACCDAGKLFPAGAIASLPPDGRSPRPAVVLPLTNIHTRASERALTNRTQPDQIGRADGSWRSNLVRQSEWTTTWLRGHFAGQETNHTTTTIRADGSASLPLVSYSL